MIYHNQNPEEEPPCNCPIGKRMVRDRENGLFGCSTQPGSCGRGKKRYLEGTCVCDNFPERNERGNIMDDSINYTHLDKNGRCSANRSRSNCTREQILNSRKLCECKTSQCGENEVPFYDGTCICETGKYRSSNGDCIDMGCRSEEYVRTGDTCTLISRCSNPNTSCKRGSGEERMDYRDYPNDGKCLPGNEISSDSGWCEPNIHNLSTITCDLPCSQNKYVENGVCTPCPPGTRNESGDDPSGNNTTCEPITCNENEYVQNNVCTPCATGTIREAGDLANGADTICESTTCGENQRVQNNECIDCPENTYSSGGHNRHGINTHCIKGEGLCGEWNIIASRGLSSGVSDTPDLSERNIIRRCLGNYCMSIDGNGDVLPDNTRGQNESVELTCSNYENYYDNIVIPMTRDMINSLNANDQINDPISTNDEKKEFTREIIEELTQCKNNAMSVCSSNSHPNPENRVDPNSIDISDRNGTCRPSKYHDSAIETVDCRTLLTFGECTGITGRSDPDTDFRDSGSGVSPYDLFVNPETSSNETIGEMVQRLNCRSGNPDERNQHCVELNRTLNQCEWIPEGSNTPVRRPPPNDR